VRAEGAVDRAVQRIGEAASWLTLAIAVLMAGNVLLRYAFSIGSVWAQELEWHLLAPLVLVGMSYALNQREHVRVDIFYARYPARVQAAVDVLAALLAVAISVLVIRYSFQYVQQSYVIGEISDEPVAVQNQLFQFTKLTQPLGQGGQLVVGQIQDCNGGQLRYGWRQRGQTQIAKR
jgi:TRAP-type mannitol/chloroaromatic compound transport system permease small subunit